MSSRHLRAWLVGSACAAMAACDPVAEGPLGPSAPNLDAAALVQPSMTGEKASGHGFIHGTTVENIADEQYSFTAVSQGDSPAAAGQVQAKFVNFQGAEFRIHAVVTCLAIEGNHGWVGSRVVRATRDGEVFPVLLGRPMVFHMTDGGEGSGSVDMASLVFFGYGDDFAYCHDRPDFPVLYPSMAGTLQVTPA